MFRTSVYRCQRPTVGTLRQSGAGRQFSTEILRDHFVSDWADVRGYAKLPAAEPVTEA